MPYLNTVDITTIFVPTAAAASDRQKVGSVFVLGGHMYRRTFALGTLLAGVAAHSSLAQGTPLAVIYIGGWDCPSCNTWKNQYKGAWEASPDFKKVKWVMVDPPSLRQAYNSSNWPADLRPVLDKLPQKSGTPRFLVMKDGSVIANRDGVGGWLAVLDVVKKA